MGKRVVRPWTPESVRDRACRLIEQTKPSCRVILRDFADWLEERGLKPISVVHRLRYAKCFFESVIGEGEDQSAFSHLQPADIEDFFVDYGERHRISSRRGMQSSLRRVLQFAAERGWAGLTLAHSVPSIYSWRLPLVPRGITESDIESLLRSLRPDSSTKSRDRAIILLLATYGVRVGQIVSLRFGDLDWNRRRILFRAHKGGKSVRQVLTAAVAEGLSCYVCEHRPSVEHNHVFLRSRRPYLPLGPAAIRRAVARRVSEAGIEGRPCSSHAFRHAFASRLINARQPFKNIADLLGHRCLRSTAIYAKVDRPFLEEVAAEWPEVLQ